MDKKLLKLKERQQGIMAQMASIMGFLGSPVRVQLLHFLSQGPLGVDTLADKTGQSLANTSMHLRKMLAAGVVDVRAEGKGRVYSLHPAAQAFWEACQDFTQEVDPALRLQTSDLYEDQEWHMDLKETLKMARQGKVVLLDARPADEGGPPLKGVPMQRLPAGDISRSRSKLPKNKPVLVFCRGRLCALSAFAVDELRKRGHRAYRLNHSWYALDQAS